MFAVWPFLLDILFITSTFAADFSGSVVSVLDGDTLKGLHNQRHHLPGERASYGSEPSKLLSEPSLFSLDECREH